MGEGSTGKEMHTDIHKYHQLALSLARRVFLLMYDAGHGTIHWCHFHITIKLYGVSRDVSGTSYLVCVLVLVR